MIEESLRRLRWERGDAGLASEDPAVQARAFAYLFGLGGLLVLGTLALPHATGRYEPGLIAPAIAALLTAALLIWRFDRTPSWVFTALPTLGSLLVTVCVFSGGGSVVAVYAMLYFWVALSAFSFLSLRAGLVNLAIAACAYGVGLLLIDGTAQIGLRWVMAIGTLTVAGVLIAALRGRVEELVVALRRHGEQQDVVAEVGRRALAGADLTQLADWAANAVTANLDAEHAGVFRLLPDEGALVLRAGVGWNPEVGKRALIPIDEPLIEQALASDGPLITDEIAGEPGNERRHFDPHSHGAPASGCRRLPPSGAGATGIAVAIRGHSGSTGVLAAYSCRGRRFGANDAAFVQSVANVLADAEQRHDAELLARRQALLDPLTGRPNRALFMDRLEEALLRARSRQTDLAVMVVDIDDFRLINDVSGNVVGDALLKAFAPRIREALVMTDTVARIGGDEFAVLCEAPGGRDEAVAIADAILTSLSTPIEIGSERYRVSACIGLVHSPEGTEGADQLLRRASAATQRARDRGPGCREAFDQGMQSAMETRLGLSQALRQAIGRGELSLVIQPIQYLAGRTVHSSEALLRWHSSRFGEVPPQRFIEIAEETGTITEIGRWTLREVCRLAAAWRTDNRARRYLPLNVNVSPRQLAQSDFVAAVAEELGRAGASPRDLGLEITERAVLHDHESAAEMLAMLREMGVTVLLDDFGTGFSSLTHLKQLPIDVVKIDRSFITSAATEPRDGAIVSAIVSMASALAIEVVAEGVQTADQVEALRGLGCLIGQGFYLAGPSPPESLVPSSSFQASSSVE